MCGILGSILEHTASPDPDRFHMALGLLEHRGPDRRSFLVVKRTGAHHLSESLESGPDPAGAQIVLGFCRLAILDLSPAGDQPMTSPDGHLHIVFNGEIFNYLEIREELVRRGWRFRSQSDTEVLLAAYQEWGADCLGKLMGMFAFAVVDKKRRVLFLARDHLGIKPLYYSFAPGRGAFSFASQIAALLKVSNLPPVAQTGALGDYLLRGYIDHTRATLFRGVEQVLPGHYLEVGVDQALPAAQVRYWSAPAGGGSELSPGEATERFRRHLEDSVRLHLRSDVPVASALSGGMDSSSIVSLMRKVQPPDTPIHTFTFVTRGCPGFDPAWDEEKWADIVGQSARAVMHKVRVDPHQLPQDCERFLLLQDGPFGSPVVWVQQKIFQAAHAEGFRAMMSGQGADELVAGYRRHIAARLASLLRQGRMGEYLRLLRAGNRQPNPEGLGLLSASLKVALPPALAAKLRRGRRLPAWLRPEFFRVHPADLPSRPSTRDVLRDVLRHDLEDSPLPALLRYEDRNSMSVSIDNRLPFVNPRIIEFVFSLPEEFLVAPDGTNKWLLRSAMRSIVPDAILDRKDKMAFPVPVAFWLLELEDWVTGILQQADEVPFLNGREIHRKWQAFRAAGGRPIPDAFLLWKWVFLLLWIRAFEVRFEPD